MRKFVPLLILCLLLALPSMSPAQDGRREYQPDFFPFSVWYAGGKARAPMMSEITPESREEWRRDLLQIKDLGFNTVRTWVEWGKTEPRQGAYNFENLRLLLELAGEVGLRVFIQMYADSAPEWVGRAYPHTRFETQSGHKVPVQSAPGYCTDNPEIADLIENFYAQTATVASEYPHFYGWDLWSEPHIINWASIDYVPNVQFCYCPGTQARFREWLQARYGSLDALNRAWYRGFEEWSEVEPPRFSTILTYTDYTDWKTFITERLARDLGARNNAVRAGGSDHVTTSHAAISSILTSPHGGTGVPDDFFMAGEVDFYGTSAYPKHNRPATHWPHWRLMTVMDFQRSANRKNNGWYIGELQAGDGTIGLLLSEPVTSEDHRIWAWTAISKGAKAINIYAYYPMSSGYESGGYGLINLDGTLTQRAVDAGGIAKVVDENQNLFIESQPVEARVGIVYNPLAQLVGGMQRPGDGAGYQNYLIGYYRILAENNVPVDFIHRTDLESGDLTPYDLIIVPYPIMLTRTAAEGLRQFVERGGRAVAEARLAWNDERGFASEIIPGLGLHEVFGVREQDAWMADLIEMTVEGNDHAALSRLGRGDVLRGTTFANTVQTLSDDANVLARINGEPAVVAHRYGDGETLFVGSYIGSANHPEQYETNSAFILGLADWAGIERPVRASSDGETDPPLVTRLQKNRDGYLLFLINHNAEARDVRINVSVDANGPYALRELISESERSATAENGSLQMETHVGGRNVQVWSLGRGRAGTP